MPDGTLQVNVSPELDLTGRTALVTGSSRNIGREIALTFARHGANVVIHAARDAEAARAVVAEARALGVRATHVLADVSDYADVDAMIDRARSEVGPINILVNNASIRPQVPFLEMSVEDWRAVLGITLDGAFHCIRLVAPDMAKRGWGRIINIAGGDGFRGKVRRSQVAAAKAGLHGLTKSLALELGPHGITVNTVVPGVIQTNRRQELYVGIDLEGRGHALPLGRQGRPADVAAACLYLTTMGDFVTGQAIHVNGGEYFG